MKIKNKVLSFIMVFVMLFLSIPPIQVSAAIQEPQLKVTVFAGEVSTELTYNGRTVLGTSAWYTNNARETMPAYCMDPTAKGPGEVSTQQYDVNIAGANMDTYAAGCILEGYPYKTPAELGVSTIAEAYAATKAAIWCGLASSPYTNINAWDASNPAVLEAMKGIIGRAKNHTDVTLALYSIKAVTQAVNDGTYITQTFKPESNYPIMNFTPELIGDYPSGTTVTKNGDSYTVSIPNAPITSSGNVQVAVLLQLKSDVILYGNPVDISGVQRLEVPIIPYEVIVESNTPYSLANSPVEPEEESINSGTIKIVKTAYGTNTGLAGAKFEVVDHLGGVLGVFTTGSDGTVTVQTNSTGAHEITEIVPPIGYALNENNHKDVIVNDDRETIVYFSNKELPTIEIVKVDANDGLKLLSGAVFTVALDGGTESFDVVTGSNGRVIISEGLKPDQTYRIIEKVAPTNYQLNTEPQYIKTVAGEKQMITFTNAHKPGLIVEKYDMDTAEVLPDCEISIRYKGGSIIWEGLTDEFGQIFLENINVGKNGAWIEIHELAAPPGYIKTQEVKEVFLKPGMTEPVVVKLDNRKKPVLEVLKVDEEGNPLSGAVIYVKKTEGEIISEYITPESGKLKITLDEEAIYSIWEERAPEGYIKEKTCHTDIKLSAGEQKQIVFVNVKKPELEILKIDSVTKEPIENTKYRVTHVEGETVSEYLTDLEGKIVLTDLKEGIYRIEETIASDGYILNLKVKEIKLSGGDSKQLVFENTKKPTLVITKTNGLTNQPIPNTTYKIQYETPDGGIETLGTYKTNSNGQIILPNMRVGWYLATETIAAQGMQLPSNPVTRIYLSAGENTYTIEGLGTTSAGESTSDTVNTESSSASGSLIVTSGSDYVIGEEIVNYPLNSIVIKKTDANTSELLTGAVFELRKVSEDISGNSGTIIGRYVTDNSGIIVITGLTAGAYIIEEVNPPTNYLLSENSQQQAWLKADGTSIIEVGFANHPYGSLLISKVDSETNRPLLGARFKVTTSSGTVVGSSNGEYTTDVNGEILIPNLKPDSYVVTELAAPEGYVINETPKAIDIGTDGKVYKLTFANQPLSGIKIIKLDSVTRETLSNVEFSLARLNGEKLGTYKTGSDGMIYIQNLEDGYYTIIETKGLEGYNWSEEPYTVEVKSGKQTILEVENDPYSSLIINKTSSKNDKPISGAEFLITKLNGEEIGYYKTDSSGQIIITGLEEGSYKVIETKAASGYLIDEEAKIVEIKDGKRTTLNVENDPLSSVLIRKIDSITKEGIYGVTFLLYDGNNNPIGQFISDNEGYVWINKELPEGKYKLRELEPADGYIGDDVPRTFYVQKGKTSEIIWENTAEVGQIVITKRSSEYNELTGLPAGSPLSGAVFEVHNITGNLVDTIVTDDRGIAASKGLPTGVYTFSEVSAPRYYALNDRTYIAEIRHNGDIVRFEVLNGIISLNLTIQKKGQHEVTPGTTMNYELYGVTNSSSGALENFYIHDRIPTDATRVTKITTGTFNERLYYKVTYKTNYRDYMVLADNLLTKNDYEFSLHPNVLGLQNGEYVTDVRLEFDKISAGFTQAKSMQVFCQVLPTVPNGYNIVNRADVGGRYGNEWESAKTSWNTTVRATQTQTVTLPKTGY